MTTAQAIKLQRAILAAGPDVAGMAARIGAERRDSARSECENVETNPNSGTPPARRREGLSPRQRAAARLLASGHTVASASRMLGIGRRTIFRWLQMPAFNVEVDSALPTPSAGQPTPSRPAIARSGGTVRNGRPPGASTGGTSLIGSDPDFREMDETIARLTYGTDRNGAIWHASARNGAIRHGAS